MDFEFEFHNITQIQQIGTSSIESEYFERSMTSTGRLKILTESLDINFQESHISNAEQNYDQIAIFNEFIDAQQNFQQHRQDQSLNIEEIQEIQENEGLTRQEIHKLKRLKIGQTSQMCTICFNEFSKGDLVKQLPCKHIHHEKCIVPWLAKHSNCPNCRQSIRESILNIIN